MKWNDTRGETVATARAITDMLCEGVYAFFGPEDSCHVESILAQARNIPMISYVSIILKLEIHFILKFNIWLIFRIPDQNSESLL